MNERDYTLFEYLSFSTGITIILNWLMFSYIYKISFTSANLIFVFSIGIVSFIIGLVCYFKKLLYIARMKADLSKEKTE